MGIEATQKRVRGITKANARELQARSVASKRARTERREADDRALRQLAPAVAEMGIGDLAGAALRTVLGRIALGDLEIAPTAVPALVKALHEVSLLEAERPTVITAGLSRADARTLLDGYRETWANRASLATAPVTAVVEVAQENVEVSGTDTSAVSS